MSFAVPSRNPRRRSNSACISAAVLILLAAGCGSAMGDSVLVERQAFLMGTEVRIQIQARSRAAGLAQSEQMLVELQSAESQLTTWREDSEFGRLNSLPAGGQSVLEPELCRLVARLMFWWEHTGGAFDPTVGPLMEAWQLHGEGRIPTPELLEEARSRTGLGHVGFSPDRCLLRTAVRLRWDSGGFGKGAALDRLRTVGRVRDWDPWLVELGGQVAVDSNSDRPPAWVIPIAHPRLRLRAAGRIELVSGSLAVSGGSERDLQVGDRRVGHILDPRAGEPAPYDGSTVVWSESALDADILATALYVMGPDQGLAWARAESIAACFGAADQARAVAWSCSQAFTDRFADPQTDSAR